MADNIKLVDFAKKKKEEEEFGYMPSEEDFQALLGGKKLKACILITINEEGALSHYVDNFSPFETLGVLDAVKTYVATSMMDS